MKDNKITGKYVSDLQSRLQAGRPSATRPCPRCKKPINAAEMTSHQRVCAPVYPGQTPPAPDPSDLENQVLSDDPMERLRQLDQQEADRIERTRG
jgi:hypothetical protein